MGLHLALQEESGAERKKSSMMRLLPRKGLFPGGRATLRGDDLQLSEERTVHIPKVPGCKTSHAQRLIQCRYQGLGLLWAALLGPGARRVLEHTGQGEGNTQTRFLGSGGPAPSGSSRSSLGTSGSCMPAASVSGVLLFPIYPLSPGAIISRYNLHCHCYSDDVQIILTFLFHLSRGFF